jgi:ABC-2 type transport system permease protein
MRQFGTILSFELKYYFKNKIFVGITVFLVTLIAIVMCFPRVSAMFSSDETVTTEEVYEVEGVMLVKAQNPEQAALTEELFSEVFVNYDVCVTDEEISGIQDKILSGKAECAFVMTGDTSYTYYVNTLSMFDMNTEIANEVLQKLYQMTAMMESGMSPETTVSIMSIEITGEVENLGVNQVDNFFYTYIMIFALYMVILLYGQMVSTNVATEKSSRAMELLITSAKPTAMMFGKVLASCLAGLIQLVAVFGAAVLFYQINKS